MGLCRKPVLVGLVFAQGFFVRNLYFISGQLRFYRPKAVQSSARILIEFSGLFWEVVW
jgi:hypothetical protein